MKSRTRSLFSAAILLAVPAVSASAFAEDECATDSDCPAGYACEEMGWGACPGMPPCPDGEECPEPPPCEEGSEWVCVPAPVECATDSDCPDDLGCVTFRWEECSGGGARPTEPSDAGGSEDTPDAGSSGSDEDGSSDPDDGEEWTCETVEQSYCAPAWVGACEVDADCGEGFSCVQAEICSCSGGGSTDVPPVPGEDSGGSSGGGTPGDAGTPEAPEGDEGRDFDDDCSCEPSGEFYCQVQEIECGDDADCPGGWTCEDFGDIVVTCADHGSGEPECEEEVVESASYCAPPGWDAWGGAAAGADGGFSAPTAVGAERDNSAGGDDDSSEEGGAEPISVPRNRNADGGGCTTAPGSASFGFGLLALAALLRRRRA